MASLNGQTIASSYEQLLSLPDGGGNGASLVAITDGDAGNTFALQLSTISAAIVQTTTTATSTPKALFIDANLSGVAAQDSTGLHLDFDRTVAGSGTAAHNDIGINLDVNSASLGTSSVIGMDIDVVGATSGTSTATGLTVNVSGADTNYAALFTGGNVGIGDTADADTKLHIKSTEDAEDSLVLAETTGAGDAEAMYRLKNGSGTWDVGYIIRSSGDIEIGRRRSGSGKASFGPAGEFVLDTDSRMSLSNTGGGANSTVFGKLAGDDLASGAVHNLFIGENAGHACTTGEYNIAIGNDALIECGASDNNIAIGYRAMYARKTYGGLGKNVAIGHYALWDSYEDWYNVAIGYEALKVQRGINANSHSEANNATWNTAVGYRSGDIINGSNTGGTGIKNTLLGADTDPTNSTGTNQTVLGYGTTGVADNAVTLGNADVTAVYMAQDKGAKIYAGDAQFAAPDNTGHLVVDLWADRGDDNADKWRIEIEDGADFTIESFTSGSWVEKLAIANDGTFTGSSSNDISDERLKENIKNITGGLDAINKLQGRTFNWKKSADMNTRTNYGLIAQEVEKVIPELIYEKGGIRELTPEVLYSEKDTIPSDKKIGDVKEQATYYKSLNTSGLVPVLIEAVKELSSKVTELENKLK